MVGGQVLDIAEDRPAQLDYLVKLHRMKTGALIKAACRMGAIAGRGGEAEVNAAEIYGDAIGLAFQIADDLLDLTATTADLGKRAGKDAEAGKATLPALLGVEEARRRAADYCEEALQAFAGLGARAEALRALARFVVSRRK